MQQGCAAGSQPKPLPAAPDAFPLTVAVPPWLTRAAGGTARCPGFRERLFTELRPLVPDDYEVRPGDFSLKGRAKRPWQATGGCAGSACLACVD